ncbi:glycerate kinase [Ignavibacterium sp.]|uniref:glycerate kinase n=1 Tax=Ignavibacterium sp. TaxID=2651167 RepID=UPI00307E8650
MKILFAPNSFKESLSSVQIVRILSEEFAEIDGEKILLPLSDGGDGFLDVIDFINSDKCRSYFFQNEFGGIISENKVLINATTEELFIESAEVIGLRKLPLHLRKPMNLNTYALGNLIKQVIAARNNSQLSYFNKIIFGIGGTATIDFGLGTVEALGVKFFDKNKNLIKPVPENFLTIDEINYSDFQLSLLKDVKISCIADVDTPLLGSNSAIELYSNQKGAGKEEIDKIKKGIEHIANLLLEKKIVSDIFALNGAGGGLAAGLNIFLKAEIIPSKSFISDLLLEEIDITEIDYLITGEGKFDIQSFEGKATGELIKKFSPKVKNIFLVCGMIDENVKDLLPENVICFQLVDYFTNTAEAIKNAEIGLRSVSKKIFQLLVSQ